MLSLEEKENLLQLLLSNNPDTKQLAIEMLQYYPELIPEYRIPLEISIFMYGEYANWVEPFREFYKEHFTLEQLKRAIDRLRIFQKVSKSYIPESIDSELAALRRYEEVRNEYEPFIALNTQAIDRYAELAFFISRAFPTQNHAVPYFRWVLKHKPSSKAWSDLGEFYFRKGDYEEAKAAYKEAIYINAANAPAQAQLGAIYFYNEQYEASIPYFEAAALHTTGERRANNFSSLASAYMHIEPLDKERIKDAFNQGFAASKRCWTLWNSYAIFLREKEGKIEEAIKAYQEGLNVHSKNALILTNLAELYAEELQDYESAAKYYQEVLSYKPNPSVYFLVTYIAVLTNHLRDYDTAFPLYLKLKRKLLNGITASDRHSITPQQWENYENAEKTLLKWKKN